MRREGRPTTKADESPEFREFWEIWRPYMNVNDGRGAARNEFVKHVEEFGANPRDMIDGARWFIRQGGNQGTDQNGKPIRIHANRWLFKMAYEDGCEQERAYQLRRAEIEASKSNVVALKQPPKSKFLQEWERREAQS